MATIRLVLTNATNTISLTLEPEENILAKDLLASLCERLGLPYPGSQGSIGQLFRSTGVGAALYCSRRGILDPEGTLRDNGMKPGDVLRFYCHVSTSASCSSINLTKDRVLSDVGLSVVVEWRDKYYPIILPAKATPQGNIEGSLLNYAVFRQIATIDSQAKVGNWLERWRYHNSRTRKWIDPYDTTISLADHFRHGDHLKLFPPENILLLDDLADEVNIIDDIVLLDDIQVTFSTEKDVLTQIQLETNEIDEAIDSTGEHHISQKIGQAALELVRGDITRQSTDAIVNAANSALRGGGGVDGAIHQAAGPQLVKASSILAPCLPGDAVLTPGFQLPAKWVIHTVGPRYEGGAKNELSVLVNAYRNCFRLAINSKLSSIAFPSISTGVYGYPIEEAAKVALKTTLETLSSQKQLALVRFVLFTSSDYQVYRQILENMMIGKGQI